MRIRQLIPAATLGFLAAGGAASAQYVFMPFDVPGSIVRINSFAIFDHALEVGPCETFRHGDQLRHICLLYFFGQIREMACEDVGPRFRVRQLHFQP